MGGIGIGKSGRNSSGLTASRAWSSGGGGAVPKRIGLNASNEKYEHDLYWDVQIVGKELTTGREQDIKESESL